MLSAARLPQVRAEDCISLQAIWEWSKGGGGGGGGERKINKYI